MREEWKIKLFLICVYTVAYQGGTTGGLKRSQIFTNDLGLLYKQQIPRSHVEVLESRVEVLESHVEVLESHVEVLKNRVEVLESHVEVLENRVEVLENRVEVLENHVEVLRSRVGVFQTLPHRDQVHRCVGVARRRHRFYKSPQTKAMSTMVTELAVRAASRREVRATPTLDF